MPDKRNVLIFADKKIICYTSPKCRIYISGNPNTNSNFFLDIMGNVLITYKRVDIMINVLITYRRVDIMINVLITYRRVDIMINVLITYRRVDIMINVLIIYRRVDIMINVPIIYIRVDRNFIYLKGIYEIFFNF